MGLVTDKCPNDDCGARILKRANHCSACGWAGPNSTTTCGSCLKKVGKANKFCWHCGGDLADTVPPRIERDRWVRTDDEFAVRVYPEDLKGYLKRKVKIEPGTLGLIEKGGRIRKDIEWGEHTLDGVFKMTQPTSIILVNAADALLRLDFEGLHDFHGVEMGCTLQAFISVGDYADFVANVMGGGTRRVTERMLEKLLTDGLFDAVQGVMSQDSLENMYDNAWWRGKLEEDVRERFSKTLNRYGLSLAQMTFLNFTGDNFEDLQAAKGENFMGVHAAEQAAAKMDLRKRVNQIAADGELGDHVTTASLLDDIAAHDSRMAINTILREDEVSETLEAALQEARLKKQLRDIESEEVDREHQRGVTLEDDELRRQLEKLQVHHLEEMEVVQTRVQTERLTQKVSEEKARIELDNLREDTALDRKLKEKSAGTQSIIELQRANTEAQVAALKQISEGETELARIDADARKHIAEADSTKDVAVASAITEQQEKRIQDLKENSQSIKDVSMHSVDAIARAKTPDWGGSRRGAAAGGMSPCPKCQTDVPSTAAFCERCGHDFRTSDKR